VKVDVGSMCVEECPEHKTADDSDVCRTLEESPMTHWLDRRKLRKYAQLFFDEAITFELLAKMSMNDLSDLGIKKFGERKKLFEEIHARQVEMYDELIRMLRDLDLDSPPMLAGGAGGGDDRAGASGTYESEPEPEPEPELGCPFEAMNDFMAVFSATDEAHQFDEALCNGCDWKTAKERGADCSTARRAFRKLMIGFHPDKIQGRYPGCKIELKPWATSAVTALTMDLNKTCRGRNSRSREHDEF
jgi:hypothetical protein